MSMMKQVLDLEQTHGTDLVRRAYAYVGALPDDDDILPHQRFERVERWLKGYSRDPDLSESLADVERALTGDCGDHRPMLERLRDRLRTALGKPAEPDYADDHYTGPRGRDVGDITAHSQADIQRTLKR